MESCRPMLSLLLTALLASAALAGPVADHTGKIKKRNVGDLDGEDISMGGYRGQILPGMVDDQVAEAFLKDAAAAGERDERRDERRDEQENEDEDEERGEMPLALPMARLVDMDESDYGEAESSPHRSKALSDNVYQAEDGDGYIPYYPTGDVYFQRRRRSHPVKHNLRKRIPHVAVREPLHQVVRARLSRRKRQIRLSDEDLAALISFLTDLKVSMERSTDACNNPAHHSAFRENELNEELGAGNGIDDDYGVGDEPPTSAEQEYPVWLMPHSYQLESAPQRRAFYYPTLLPGQKRSSFSRHYPSVKLLQRKLVSAGLSSPSDSGPSRRFYQ